jgi:transcriptional regulator with XRE-family HTH domain
MGKVVGENLKRLRQQRRQTQPDAAQFLHEHGLAWTRDHLSNVELGRRPVMELNTLMLLSWAYRVPLSEWFAGGGDVILSKTVTATREQVRNALPGSVGALTAHGELVQVITEKLRTAPSASVEADLAVSERLKVPGGQVVAGARTLWAGRTLTQERDRRLGDTSTMSPRTLQAKRGAMTRQLTREIAELFAKGEGPK